MVWKNLNDILRNKSSKKNNIGSIKTNNNKLTYDKSEIADSMNHIFSTIGKQLNDNCTPRTATDEHLEPSFFEKTFYWEPVSTGEVHNIIKNMNLNKSNGPNEPFNYFFKIANDIITQPLTILINKCLEEGSFPDILKKACVIPIFKSGDPQLSKNY